MTKTFRFQPLIFFIFLSFLIHFCFFYALSKFSFLDNSIGRLKLAPSKPIEITFEKPKIKENNKTFFIEDSDAAQRVNKLKKITNFISQYMRETQEETQRKEDSQNKNNKNQRLKSKLNKTQSNEKKLSNLKRLQINSDLNTSKPEEEKGDLLLPSSTNTSDLQNSIREQKLYQYLPDIKEAQITALNSRATLNYTFFKRLNERLYYKWISEIHTYASTLSTEERRKLTFRDRSTRVEVVLSPVGEFIDSKIHSSCGDDFLDEIAIRAFSLTSPHLNPPKNMIQSDGFIHLHYNFTLVGRYSLSSRKQK